MTPRRLAGLGVALAGGAALVAGSLARGATLRTGANIFVNRDRPGLNAHNSPAVAADLADPARLAVADRIDTPAFSCSLHTSGNGGTTWRPLEIPLPAAANCFWPDVAFDDDGDLLVLYTSTGGQFNLPVSVWLQRFEGDREAGKPVQVAGSEAFHARLALSGKTMFASWVQAGEATRGKPLGFGPPPNPIVVARSDDGGRSFAPPVTVSEPDRLVIQPTLVPAPGRLVVGALDLGDDRLNYEALHEGQGGPPPEGHWRVVAWTSADGGRTFGPASLVTNDVAIPQRIIPDLGPTPSFARDPRTGDLYASWDGGRGDGRDVFLARSSDGGTTWAAPQAVPEAQGGQFLPAVAVAPDGRVDLAFYDRRRDPQDAMAEITLASSWDRGRSFLAATISDRPFDSRIGLGSVQGIPLLGSQIALHPEPGRTLAFWSDTRQGTIDTNIQDLALAIVEVRSEQGPRRPLQVLGAVLALAGLAVAVSGRRREPGA